MKHLFIFIFYFISMTIAYAQNFEIKFEHISINEGLSHENVFAIAQDSSGYLWFGTGDGLDKYNGLNINTLYHNPNNNNSLSSSNFGKIFVENDSIFWLGTYGGGLNKYNVFSNSFTRFENNPDDKNSISDNSIEFIFKDSKGIIWIGTAAGGLNKMINENGKIYFKNFQFDENNPNTISDNRARIICEDNQGNLWIGTGNGLNKFNPDNETFTYYFNDKNNPNSISANRIQSIFFDKNNILWIGTRKGGLNKFDITNQKFTSFINDPNNENSLSDNNVEFIFEDSYGFLWLGTYNGGLNRFDKETNDFLIFKHDAANPYSISHDRIEYIFEDNSQILWIGTRGGGVNKLDLKPKKFNNIEYAPDETDKLPHPSVFSIIIDNQENFWFGTDGGGIGIFEKNNNKYSHINTSNSIIKSNRIWSLLIDNQNNIWVGTYHGGLSKITKKEEKYNIENIDFNNETANSTKGSTINVLYQLKSRKILAGTENALNVITYTENELKIDKYFENKTIKAIIEDNENNIWIGTQAGLILLDKNFSLIEEFNHSEEEINSISNSEIFSLFIDNQENLWIGTKGGGLNLFHKETKTFTHYFEKDGLANNVIAAIEQDNAENLWISTNFGLSKFDFKNEEFKNYTLIHGLSSPGFNHNAVAKTSSGELYFGNIAGITYFCPDEVVDNKNIPKIVITDFKIFNNSVFENTYSELYHNFIFNKYIELSWEQNVFSFDFAALDYTSPEHNNYAYIMEGFENEWNYVENRHYVMYTNLPHGNYKFKIKASNSDNIWNEEGICLNIRINPPFWKTWFFKISVIIFLIILILAIYRIRIRQITKQNIKLEMLVRRRTAEVEQQKEEIRTQSEHIQKAHESLLKQNKIIEFQNHNLKASILYAQTIQEAILPTFQNIKEYFNHFVIFKPKDIVSGDFYWTSIFQKQDIIQIFVIVADCTGHGVPGAFMSMIGSRLLSEIINEHNVVETNQILEELDFRFRKALRQEQTDNRDGMDIIVSKYIIDKNNINLHFSGAKLPLYVFLNNEFKKLEADRRNVGGSNAKTNIIFSKKIIALNKNDTIYYSTDGLPDQNNFIRKRFGKTQLINILKEVHNENVEFQQNIIETKLNDWMQNCEQRDDITLLGIKI